MSRNTIWRTSRDWGILSFVIGSSSSFLFPLDGARNTIWRPSRDCILMWVLLHLSFHFHYLWSSTQLAPAQLFKIPLSHMYYFSLKVTYEIQLQSISIIIKYDLLRIIWIAIILTTGVVNCSRCRWQCVKGIAFDGCCITVI